MELQLIETITKVGSFGLVVLMFIWFPKELKAQRESHEKIVSLLTEKFSVHLDKLSNTIDKLSMLIMHILYKNSTPQEYKAAIETLDEVKK